MPSQQRTCIGCRRKGDQATFLRVSRMSGGRVVLWGKACEGRSAYLCEKSECMEAALAKGRLERALKTPVSADDRERLRKELECKLR